MTIDINWQRQAPPSANSAFARLIPQPETGDGEVEFIYELVSEYPTWCVDSASPVLIRSSITDSTYLS